MPGASGKAGQEEGREEVKWGGDGWTGKRLDQGQEVGELGGSDAKQIFTFSWAWSTFMDQHKLTPVILLVQVRLVPSGQQEPSPGQGNKYSLTPQIPQLGKIPLQDTTDAMLAPLHHCPGNHSGLGC